MRFKLVRKALQFGGEGSAFGVVGAEIDGLAEMRKCGRGLAAGEEDAGEAFVDFEVLGIEEPGFVVTAHGVVEISGGQKAIALAGPGEAREFAVAAEFGAGGLDKTRIGLAQEGGTWNFWRPIHRACVDRDGARGGRAAGECDAEEEKEGSCEGKHGKQEVGGVGRAYHNE